VPAAGEDVAPALVLGGRLLAAPSAVPGVAVEEAAGAVGDPAGAVDAPEAPGAEEAGAGCAAVGASARLHPASESPASSDIASRRPAREGARGKERVSVGMVFMGHLRNFAVVSRRQANNP